MNLKELAHILKTRNGITYSTLYGWLARGYLPKKDTYAEKDIEKITAKIPYCMECGKRLPMETALHVCSKCNNAAKTVCQKCGAIVHKYFNRRLVMNPICRKCSLNDPKVTEAVRNACRRSWSLHGQERADAVARTVKSTAHREKMKECTTKVWERPGYREQVRLAQSATHAKKWEECGTRDYPHAKRLSLHVFRCRHCDNVYVDIDLNNERQPSVNYCPNCADRYTGPEKIIELYLKRTEIEFIPHWRPPWLFGKELDFYIPAYNLAIEIDGVFYHSEQGGKDKWYHVEKTEACEKNGIHLIHIWDLEASYKWDIVKDRLNSLLQQNTCRIGARHCQIREIKSTIAREFLEGNHIQGFTPCSEYCGIYYNTSLVGVAAFHKGRTANPGEWELARYATLIGMHISGGMSKAVAWFRRKYPGVPLISYADRRWTASIRNAYAPYSLVRKTSPSYYYAYHQRLHRREKFMIKRLAKNPITAKVYSPGMSERECCEKVPGLFKIWDCGQLLYRII